LEIAVELGYLNEFRVLSMLNRTGRRTILAILLIVALAILWNLLPR